MAENEKTNRVMKWDNAKCVLIFFVVLGHLINETVSYTYDPDLAVLEKINFFIYTFHMPAFIFISGLFSKKTVDNKRYDKIGSYLRLYFVMTFIVFFSKFIIRGRAPYSLMYELGVPWYALSLFSMFLIMIFLRSYNKTEVMIGVIVLGALIGYDKHAGSFLCLSRTLTFLPFFVLGYYLDIKKLVEFLEQKIVKIVSAVILVVYAVAVSLNTEKVYYLYKNFFKGRSTYKGTFKIDIVGEGFNSYGWLYRIIYYILVTILIMAFFSLIPNTKTVLSKLGSRTLPVFAIHYGVVFIIVNLGFSGFVKDAPNQWLGLLIIAAVALLIQLILSVKPFADLFLKMMSANKSFSANITQGEKTQK